MMVDELAANLAEWMEFLKAEEKVESKVLHSAVA
jgi:hypothetical protein